MTLQRVLIGISALILLYFAVTYFLIAYTFAVNGSTSVPSVAALTFLVLVTMAVCFVTSYRQILTQRPRLILICLSLIIASDLTMYFMLEIFLDNPENRALTEEFNRAMIEGIENSDNLANKEELIDYFSLPESTFKETFQSIIITAALMAIPIYANFRKVSSTRSE